MFPTRTSNILSESALSAPPWYFFPSISNPILHLMHFIPFLLHTPKQSQDPSSHLAVTPPYFSSSSFLLFHLKICSVPVPWQWQMRATGSTPNFSVPWAAVTTLSTIRPYQFYISPRMSWDIRWSYDSSGAIWRTGELSSKPINSMLQHIGTSILDFVLIYTLDKTLYSLKI